MQVVSADVVRQFNPDKMQKVNLVETPRLFCDVYCLQAGQAQKVHRHQGADKLYYVLEGTAVFTVGSEEQCVSAGHVVLAPADVDHGVRNETRDGVRLLVLMAPNPNVQETATRA